MFALSSHSNHNNLNHQLKGCFGVCFPKKDLAFYPEMQQGGEAQLVKLSNSTISMGKYVRSGLALFHSVCVLSAGSLGCTSMRLEYHGFSRWSEQLIKQSMRG